jgi:hypothetical protein
LGPSETRVTHSRSATVTADAVSGTVTGASPIPDGSSGQPRGACGNPPRPVRVEGERASARSGGTFCQRAGSSKASFVRPAPKTSVEGEFWSSGSLYRQNQVPSYRSRQRHRVPSLAVEADRCARTHGKVRGSRAPQSQDASPIRRHRQTDRGALSWYCGTFTAFRNYAVYMSPM